MPEPVHIVNDPRLLDRTDDLDLGVADQSGVGVRLAPGKEALVLRGDGFDIGLELRFVKKASFRRAARGVSNGSGCSSDLKS